jgi:ubiquitin C-terminal hydrolase
MTSNVTAYKAGTVDAQRIFYQELKELNPDNEQFDTAEFMTIILDRLHEELTDIYVSNGKEEDTKANEWLETAEKHNKIVKDHN